MISRSMLIAGIVTAAVMTPAKADMGLLDYLPPDLMGVEWLQNPTSRVYGVPTADTPFTEAAQSIYELGEFRIQPAVLRGDAGEEAMFAFLEKAEERPLALGPVQDILQFMPDEIEGCRQVVGFSWRTSTESGEATDQALIGCVVDDQHSISVVSANGTPIENLRMSEAAIRAILDEMGSRSE